MKTASINVPPFAFNVFVKNGKKTFSLSKQYELNGKIVYQDIYFNKTEAILLKRLLKKVKG